MYLILIIFLEFFFLFKFYFPKIFLPKIHALPVQNTPNSVFLVIDQGAWFARKAIIYTAMTVMAFLKHVINAPPKGWLFREVNKIFFLINFIYF